ncbi:MAG TPA: MmcQ/YjbR family DNA-binding protein [Anaerolineae bacterium]|nr:MmcQ/YjbR family DNA-binding protein [Anaerolineae bacterium]
MMNREAVRRCLLGMNEVVEERPFGPDVAVFKVRGKMFALLPDDEPVRLNLKCEPAEALLLRGMYEAIQPGYHMNKRHWNTVTFDGTVPDEVLQRMMDDSYRLVVRGMKKVDQRELLGEN